MKVIIKYNRQSTDSKFYLSRWIKIFKDYEKIILSDIQADYSGIDLTDCKVVSSNMRYGDTHKNWYYGRWKNATIANFTAYELAKNDTYFWLIDGDDTVLLNSDVGLLQSKFKKVETIAKIRNLDGLSLDFYRELLNHWSFGVALLKPNIDFSRIELITTEDLKPYDLNESMNMDLLFDMLRHRGVYKLESFVFEDCGFYHSNKYTLNNYYWKNKMLWDIPLKEDVIVI